MITHESKRTSSKRSRKHAFRESLLFHDFSEMIQDPLAFGPLISLLFDPNQLVQWRAIDALARVAEFRAETSLESVREILRRLFWAMNDESGGFIWKAPEAAARILTTVPQLMDEYASILLSHHNLPFFQSGVYYASWPIASLSPYKVQAWKEDLVLGMRSKKPEDRAYVSTALKLADPDFYQASLKTGSDDNSRFNYYNFVSGQFLETRVDEFIETFGPQDSFKKNI